MLLPELAPSSAESRQALLRRIELGEPQGIVDHRARIRPGNRQRPGRRKHLLLDPDHLPAVRDNNDLHIWEDVGIYGWKPFLAIGPMLFACGSIAVSLCSEMEPFIPCRAVQGLGSGIPIPVDTAAVGDIYVIGSRTKMTGVLGAVYGIGSRMGPPIGGFIIGYTTRHLAFYINIPMAMICTLLVLNSYPTVEPDKSARIDYIGTAILSTFPLDIPLLMEC